MDRRVGTELDRVRLFTDYPSYRPRAEVPPHGVNVYVVM